MAKDVFVTNAQAKEIRASFAKNALAKNAPDTKAMKQQPKPSSPPPFSE